MGRILEVIVVVSTLTYNPLFAQQSRYSLLGWGSSVLTPDFAAVPQSQRPSTEAAPCDSDEKCPLGYVCETTTLGECNPPLRFCVPGCRSGTRPCAATQQCVAVTCRTCPCPDLCEEVPPPPDPCEQPTTEIANGGFENGSYGEWTVDYGSYRDTVASNLFGVPHDVDWHATEPGQPSPAIITATTPPMLHQATSVTPYCGRSMLRINDLGGGFHATRVRQKIVRPAGSGTCAVLRVHWGAALQDPGHNHKQQPFFLIEAFKNGELLYSERDDASDHAANGWTNITGPNTTDKVWYRDALSVIPLIGTKAGDEIEIRLTVADCSVGDHGGAAYLDCVDIFDRCANPCPFIGKEPLKNLVVPNVFTPNGDGINDVWLINNAEAACTASATIRDRWGVVVAHPSWSDPDGATSGSIPLWDGRRDDGVPALPSGNPYFFVLTVANCAETREIPGFVYIFRQPLIEQGNLLHVVAPGPSDTLWHTIRFADEYTWQDFRDVERVAGDAGQFVDVASAVVAGEFHVVGVSSDGSLWHTIRHAGGWDQFRNVEDAAGRPATGSGVFKRVAAAEVIGELHVCAIDDQGKLWHTIRHPSSWQAFGDVASKTGGPADNGAFIDVGCAGVNGELHVVLATDHGNLYHTIRHRYAWQNYLGDVRSVAGPPFLHDPVIRVAAGSLNGELHVCAVTPAGAIYHTVRHTSTWQYFGNVMDVASPPASIVFTDVGCDGSGGELHLIGLSAAGELWHTIRHGATWDKFGNIGDTFAGHRGTLRAVAVSGALVR